MTKRLLWTSGEDGYHTYRIPTLIAAANGDVLAIVEGRMHSRRDTGQIDLLLKRSTDGGRTFGAQQVILSKPHKTCGNPTPLLDERTGQLHLLHCENNDDGPERLIVEGKAPRTVWHQVSTDHGHTWSQPRDLSPQIKRANWTWYATGPCHGIQLRRGPHAGRLVAPCDHIVGVTFNHDTDPFYSHLIYSDDAGQTWHIGAIAEDGTNECSVVETTDARLLLNCRPWRRITTRCRAQTYSADAGLTFEPVQWRTDLPDPCCQGSIIRHSARDRGDDADRLLFVNCDSMERANLTLRISLDEGATWPQRIVIDERPTSYSDLLVLADKTILCLYEYRAEDTVKQLVLARLHLDD